MSSRLALALFGVLVLGGTHAPAWTAARPDYAWSFPRDHWAHDGYKTEWWYFTGHLAPAGDTTPRFGYQFTFFRLGITPDTPAVRSPWAVTHLLMGHLAVTDRATGRHVFSEVLWRAAPLLAEFGAPGDSLIAWSAAPAGTDGRWTLRWTGTGFAFTARDDAAGLALDLATAARKPLVFQGPNGYSRKGDGPSAASQYYSFTRLATSGRVVTGGDTVAVTGESWMDKEFGSNQLDEDQAGWDWFSLQLDDGRELMLYVLRDTTGAVDYARGTLVAADGTPRWLDGAAFGLRATDSWTSPVTDARYPSAWTVSVPSAGLALTVQPVIRAQENVSALVPGLAYWEGAVTVRAADGRPVGRGYVELTGYRQGGRLPL